jgi:hypothetical protein
VRIYLPVVLRKRFDRAWGIVPKRQRAKLDDTLVSVRIVERLEGLVIRLSDGSRYRLGDKPGFGYCCVHGGSHGLDLRLVFTRELAVEDEVWALATILHELAHALDYYDYGQTAFQWPADQSEHRAEYGCPLEPRCWRSCY